MEGVPSAPSTGHPVTRRGGIYTAGRTKVHAYPSTFTVHDRDDTTGYGFDLTDLDDLIACLQHVQHTIRGGGA